MTATDTPEAPLPGAYASSPLDKRLLQFRDRSIPVHRPDFIEAHPGIEAAAMVYYAALADFVDAYRADPAFGYQDALDAAQEVLDRLPPAPDSEMALQQIVDGDPDADLEDDDEDGDHE